MSRDIKMREGFNPGSKPPKESGLYVVKVSATLEMTDWWDAERKLWCYAESKRPYTNQNPKPWRPCAETR